MSNSEAPSLKGLCKRCYPIVMKRLEWENARLNKVLELAASVIASSEKMVEAVKNKDRPA